LQVSATSLIIALVRFWFGERTKQAMRRVHLALYCLVFVSGCRQPDVPGPRGEEVIGPGRFPHCVLYRTIAPWDGPATQLYLSENPLQEGNPSGPLVSIRIYKAPGSLAGQRQWLGGPETREGQAAWLDGQGRSTPVSVEVEFEEVREGAQVAGKYEVTFPDGKRERGRFQANWWKAEGRDG
jgi:hypothetical protein